MKRFLLFFVFMTLAACSTEPSYSSVNTAIAETQSAKPTNTTKQSDTPLPAAANTPEPTATVEPTATPITYSISGQVYFDFNGTGELEVELGEKPIVGAKVCVGKKNGDFCALSDEDGSYQVDGLQPGKQIIYVLTEEIDYSNLEDLFRTVIEDDVEKKVPPEFRILSIGEGWKKREGYTIGELEVPAWRVPLNEIEDLNLPTIIEELSSNMHLDLGLMEGELTNIFTCEDLELLPIKVYFDLDPREGHVRNYRGDTNGLTGRRDGTLKLFQTVKEATRDGHSGFDQGSLSYNVIGFWVLSPVPGQVYSNELRKYHISGYSEDKIVIISFDGLRSLLAHNKDFVTEVNSEVERYQPVGTIGMTGATIHPHTHLDIAYGADIEIDIFRDLYSPTSRGYWTKDNDPICIPAKYLDPEQWPDT